MSGFLVVDLETDGLLDSVSTIHMIGIVDLLTDEYTSYSGERVVDGLIRLAEADVIVGHYFRGYDAKVIAALSNGFVTIEQDRIIDTCELSQAFYPELPNHKLATWGEVLGYPKGDHSDWSCYSEDMDRYCERDVRLTAEVFRYFLQMHEDVVGELVALARQP